MAEYKPRLLKTPDFHSQQSAAKMITNGHVNEIIAKLHVKYCRRDSSKMNETVDECMNQ